MIPIYRQSDIKAFDNSLAAKGLLEIAISRAGYGVFVLAAELMGGSCYGRKVVVLYGPGNNGRDALLAGMHLRSSGAVVKEVRYGSPEFLDSSTYYEADLVVDGCFGVGLSRTFQAPSLVPGIPVLAIDVPSGLDGDRGSTMGSAVHADATLCLSGLKLGTLISQGPDFCGDVYISDLGLGELEPPAMKEYLVEDSDIGLLSARRDRTDHKWTHSVAVISGSPGMDGAANLVCRSGYFVGAGIVHLYTDASIGSSDYGVETVVHSVAVADLDDEARADLFETIGKRFKSIVIGPGLGGNERLKQVVGDAILSRRRLVIDADAVSAVPSVDWLANLAGRDHPGIVMTPHDAELRALLERSGGRLSDSYSRDDRCTFAREFSETTGVVLLMKGGPTVVASPRGDCYLTTAPDASLAVAGSGDVLSGMIGAALAYEGDAAELAAVTAHLHGLAGRSLGVGPSGEIADKARDILLNCQTLDLSVGENRFVKPTRLEGVLVARNELLGKRSLHRV